jgi:hypothetical protein
MLMPASPDLALLVLASHLAPLVSTSSLSVALVLAPLSGLLVPVLLLAALLADEPSLPWSWSRRVSRSEGCGTVRGVGAGRRCRPR